MNLPSKELLTEVLGVRPIVEMQYEFDSDYNTYFIRTNSGKESIYPYFLIDPTIIIVSDLAHKCKEWAYDNDYILSVMYRKDYRHGGLRDEPSMCIVDGYNMPTSREFFEAESEPEAIFKACQYILDNKGAK